MFSNIQKLETLKNVYIYSGFVVIRLDVFSTSLYKGPKANTVATELH